MPATLTAPEQVAVTREPLVLLLSRAARATPETVSVVRQPARGTCPADVPAAVAAPVTRTRGAVRSTDTLKVTCAV